MSGNSERDKPWKDLELQLKGTEEYCNEYCNRVAADRLHIELRIALQEGGVDPKRVHQAANLLIGSNQVYLNNKRRSVFRDGFEDVELATGVQNWVKTEEAKVFLKSEATKVSAAPASKPTSGPTREEIAIKFRDALVGKAPTKKYTRDEVAEMLRDYLLHRGTINLK